MPLANATAGPETSWAVLAMGHLGDATNTFWQIFHRSGASMRWELSTPPGVASNGGLVATIGSSGAVTAGFEPSQGLSFSPLAQTADEGSSWSQGLLPGGLGPGPDTLTSGEGRYLGLLRTAGGELVGNSGDLTTWTTLATLHTLAADPATAACGITSLSAVTYGGTGHPVVGAACARGTRPGLFELVNGRWRSVGPVLPGSASQPTQVVRLLRTPAGVTALVSVGSTPASRKLFALWSADGSGSWAVSAPLRPPAPLASTGVTATGGLVVVTGGQGRGRTASVVSPAGGAPWTRLPMPPSGTAVVVDGPGGTVEALVADRSTLQVDALEAGGWHRIQTLNVDIQYGSSS